MKKILCLIGVVCLTACLSAQENNADYTVQSVRYWFDTETLHHTAAFKAGTVDIDASAVDEGFHVLNYQVIADNQTSSPVRTAMFYRLKSTDETFGGYTVQSVRYWFDTETSHHTAAYKAGTVEIDASAMDEGFHVLNYQVIADNQTSSPVRTAMFYRLKSTDETFADYSVQNVRYWMDNDTIVYTAPYSGENTILDLKDVSEGSHTLWCQVVTDAGQTSPAHSIDFFRGIYDIYVSEPTVYTEKLITENSLFAQKPDLKLHYQTNDISVRGHLTVDEGTVLSLGTFIQTANWGNNHSDEMFDNIGEEYYHPTTLVNNGFVRADSILVKQNLWRDCWHFLSFPFNADMNRMEAPEGTYYAVRRYDGYERAEGRLEEAWKKLRKSDIMEAYNGYILQLTNESDANTAQLIFKAVNDANKNNIFISEDVTLPLKEYPSEFAHHRSWNFIGNPYPCFFNTHWIEQDGTVTVWNGKGYSSWSLTDDDYVLMPYEAFFIQQPLHSSSLLFHKEGCVHNYDDNPSAAAPRRRIYNPNRRILNFSLSDGTDSDYTRIVFNPEASTDYEIDKDAPKMMEETPQMPQLYSIEGGIRFAINERPKDNGLMIFSVYAPANGQYRFSADNTEQRLVVLDTETGTRWNLDEGEYVFTATQGIHNARLVVSSAEVATDVTGVDIFTDGEMQILSGQAIFRFMEEKLIRIYAMDGKLIYNNITRHANIQLANGVYIAVVNGETRKIMVK